MPHAEYFEDFWIKCETCHTNPTTEASPQPCSNCHHASPIDASDESLSSKVVVHRSCWRCHESGTGSEASIGCVLCHLGARTDPMARRGSDGGAVTP
jgi:DnaJ-class molecular chaperone